MVAKTKNRRIIIFDYQPPIVYFCPNPDELSKVATRAKRDLVDISKTFKTTSPLQNLSEIHLKLLMGSAIMYMIPYLIEYDTLKNLEGTPYSKYKDFALGAFQLLISEGVFIKHARKVKNAILLEPEGRVAIEILKYLSTEPVISKKAKRSSTEMLSSAGLGIYVPSQPKNIQSNPRLVFLGQRPQEVYATLKELQEIISNYVDSRQELGSKENKKKIEKAFKHKFGINFKEDTLAEKLFSRPNIYRQKRFLAIAFLCFMYDISTYNSVYNLIYKKFPKSYKNHPEIFKSIKNS